MDAATADTRILPFSSHTGTRYDGETRERARQLWSFVHGRNGEAVAAAMQEECPGLEGRTVRRWAAEDGWAERVERDIRELAPAVHGATVVDLIAGSGEAIGYLRAAVRGEQKAEPARVNAALGILDRVGFGRREGPLLPEPAAAGDAESEAETGEQATERARRMLEEVRRKRGRG